MLRRAALALVALLALLAGSAPVGRAQDAIDLNLRVAKTQHRVTLFGYVEPRRSGRVAVRLFRFREEKWVRLGSRRVELSGSEDSDGDGTNESFFRARFPRPKTGRCRGVAKLVGEDVREIEEFPCYIPDFPRGTAQITALADDLEIDVLIADNDEHRQYGFMYRPRIPTDLGMAFLWEEDTSGGFWMKNTLVPLSIAFFDDNGVILRIMDMDPCLEDPCESYDPGVSYRGALEVVQGAYDDWGVSEGDRITISR